MPTIVNGRSLSSAGAGVGGGERDALQGVGNPNGVVVSDFGDIYEDTTTGLFYRQTTSPSGDTWVLE
jgi:hypothetical protein